MVSFTSLFESCTASGMLKEPFAGWLECDSVHLFCFSWDTRCAKDRRTEGFFTYVLLERHISAVHPPRSIHTLSDEALSGLSRRPAHRWISDRARLLRDNTQVFHRTLSSANTSLSRVTIAHPQTPDAYPGRQLPIRVGDFGRMKRTLDTT